MTDLLSQFNQLLTSAVLIVAFSLLAYVALQNWRNDVSRALCFLLAGLVIVNAGDVLIDRATLPATIDGLLRFQWLGIALVPAAYLHLADALLTASSGSLQHRRPFVWLGYLGSAGVLGLALQTDLLVRGGILVGGAFAQFGAGPLFFLYVLFILASMLVALWAIIDARRRALSPTLRRRLTYLGATFGAPGLGVFPYMVVAGAYASLSPWGIILLSAIVNMAVMLMITVMTYSVAFQGVLLPDRLVKQDFIRWGLYGPVVGLATILFLQIIPWLEHVLDVPSTTLLPFGVMLMTVLMPLFVSRAKPYIDMLVYLQDREEIDYLRNLPRSTFTRTDLRQLLEGTLMAICGALQVETGFVVGRGADDDNDESVYAVKALCGSRRDVKRFVAEYPLTTLVPQIERLPHNGPATLMPEGSFLACSNFCLLPLRSPDGVFLGALGIALPPEALGSNGVLTTETRRLIGSLSHQIALALTTVQMQQRLFDTLRGLGPEMRSLQELTTRLEQATPASLTALESDVSLHPEFTQLVKDTLAHYWGGPKLSDSPLLGLRTVRRLIQDQGGSPTRALQSVLRQAIDNLRPDEQLDPSAQEWLLYNLLEMRFLQGKPVRDAASRLAMSESDFYRKQRVAIEEVARQLTLMEDSER